MHTSYTLSCSASRLIEDSGGRLKLHTCYDEKYLNTIMEEAATNVAVFFRALGGNPSFQANPTPAGSPQQPYNKKFTSTANRCCKVYNHGKTEHLVELLSLDGTCKFNDVCNHWVSSASGKYAQCKQNHMAINCNNPLACAEPVKV